MFKVFKDWSFDANKYKRILYKLGLSVDFEDPEKWDAMCKNKQIYYDPTPSPSPYTITGGNTLTVNSVSFQSATQESYEHMDYRFEWQHKETGSIIAISTSKNEKSFYEGDDLEKVRDLIDVTNPEAFPLDAKIKAVRSNMDIHNKSVRTYYTIVFVGKIAYRVCVEAFDCELDSLELPSIQAIV